MKDHLLNEVESARRHAKETHPPVEPSEEEKNNGWTTETLTAYLAERTAGQSLEIDTDSVVRRLARRPVQQNNRYNPLRWHR